MCPFVYKTLHAAASKSCVRVTEKVWYGCTYALGYGIACPQRMFNSVRTLRVRVRMRLVAGVLLELRRDLLPAMRPCLSSYRNIVAFKPVETRFLYMAMALKEETETVDCQRSFLFRQRRAAFEREQ
ncbi:uncharacterized protein LOC125944102 [Dermacentor silvarum]|uniref:uncharacterized protein LOC125944102 n=1 Tax=Dermacentor silvarum TaxID=543639 RepID=UPI0021018257|nr:uncharacterized protein LOC125944102 [Dermacentor silvarum]